VCFYYSLYIADWAVGVPIGFINILLLVTLIVVLVRRSSGTESKDNRTQPSPE